MENIYFSNWVVPCFVGVGLFSLFTCIAIFLALSLTSRNLNSVDLQKIKSKMNISSELSDNEIQNMYSRVSFVKKWPYFLVLLLCIGYFTLPPLFQVYFVQIKQDGTWILKNCYHITLGEINKDEKRTIEYQKKVLRGRGVTRAIIHTDTKTYKTVSNVSDTIYDASQKLLKK